MIVGIGSDICNIQRIEEMIQKHPQSYMRRFFSASEQAEINSRDKISEREYACRIAKRFAAKEACSKALGTGLRSGTYWKDMQILHLQSGKPELHLNGGALNNLQKLAPSEKFACHVSMSDDYPWAQAFVIIETIWVQICLWGWYKKNIVYD